jgi:hypothetical protein
VKLGGGRYRAATKVNVLSPEITSVSEAETVHVVAGSILITVKGKAYSY